MTPGRISSAAQPGPAAVLALCALAGLFGPAAFGSSPCNAWDLLVLGATGVVAAALTLRLPGPTLVSLLPAVLLPAWLACGTFATTSTAALALVVFWILPRHPGETPLGGLVAQGAGLAGALALGAAASVFGAGDELERYVIGGAFMVGHAAADAAVRRLVTDSPIGDAVALAPRSHILVNLLLVLPGLVLARLLLDRDPVVSVPLFALFLVALALIRLYIESETARQDVARLRSIVEHTPDGLVAVGPDFRLSWLNDTAGRLTGVEVPKAVGHACGHVVRLQTAGGTPVDHEEAFLRAAQSGMPVHTSGTLLTPDGRRTPVAVTYTAVVDAEGRMEVGVAALRETDPADLLDDRAAALGHELRSPLTSIIGYAKLMQSRADLLDGPHRAEFVSRIAESGDYMLRLVNNLLDLRRLESGIEEFRPAPVDLETVVAGALSMAQPKATEKGIRLFSEVGRGAHELVTDELMLRRVVDNLISNAVKYTPAGGSVRVTARRRDDTVDLSVSDTGIGLSAEELDRLFERFFRSERPEARQERGSGLGLVLVRETVRQMGGDIRVESTLGRGSTFTVSVPARPPARASGGDSERAHPSVA